MWWLRCAVMLGVASCNWVVRAEPIVDFATAVKAYASGDYDAARDVFTRLAALGDGASQYNLGAMAWQGHGMESDPAAALGWIRAAESNGYAIDDALLETLRRQVQGEQLAKTEMIMGRYGRESLATTTLPTFTADCSGWVLPVVRVKALPGLPAHDSGIFNEAHRGLEGAVVLTFTLGVDGLPRDPDVIFSEPAWIYDYVALRALLKSRFEPVVRDGQPREQRSYYAYVFSFDNGAGAYRAQSWATGVRRRSTVESRRFWGPEVIERARGLADQGDPSAQYWLGRGAFADERVGMTRAEAMKRVLAAAQGGHPAAQMWIGDYFVNYERCSDPNKARPWLESGVSNDHDGARVGLARLLLRDPGNNNVARALQLLTDVGTRDNAHVLKHAIGLLAASPIEGVRHPAHALTLARHLRANWSEVDPQRVEAHAAALAANGSFLHAHRRQRIAISDAKRLGWNTQAMEERLAAYADKRVWTGDLYWVPPGERRGADED